MPDPTIVNIKKNMYLVVTELGFDCQPCLNFHKINQEDVSSEPSFRVEGAEILLDCNDKGTITYLTNSILLLGKEVQNGLDYARLRSPSHVVQISYETLQSIRRLNSEQALNEIVKSGKRWAISSDLDSIIFFRTQSHSYAFIEATMAEKAFVLRFYGSHSGKIPVAIYFKMIEKQAA